MFQKKGEECNTRAVLGTYQGGYPMERNTRELSRTSSRPTTELDDTPRPFFPHDFFALDTELGQNDPTPEVLMMIDGRKTLSPDGTS